MSIPYNRKQKTFELFRRTIGPRALDARTLASLLDSYAAALELYAALWTNNPEDCVQEAFVELARRPTLPENPPAWLYRVAKNKALNASRASRRRTDHEQIAARLRAENTNNSTGIPDKVDVALALTNLDEAAREIVMLRLWSGLTWREIAELTKVPASTVQRYYAESLIALRKLFDVNVS